MTLIDIFLMTLRFLLVAGGSMVAIFIAGIMALNKRSTVVSLLGIVLLVFLFMIGIKSPLYLQAWDWVGGR